jgi:hypothetical protein
MPTEAHAQIREATLGSMAVWHTVVDSKGSIDCADRLADFCRVNGYRFSGYFFT